MMASPKGFEEPSVSKSDVGDAGAIAKLRQRRRDANLSLALIRLQQAQRARAPVFRPVKIKAPRQCLSAFIWWAVKDSNLGPID
ncbi:hypothetical protein [Xanthomonas citri]|uniref:hypothetical protein n=1 Tax=Xanthomonas citri TaxID=346 RepID=UPI0012FE7567|nr:hypothetical protein [Xanthomonas citri]